VEGPVTEPIHPQFMRPRRYEHVEFLNKYGERFDGRVTHVHKTNKRIIWVRLDGTVEPMQIDMDNIWKWQYQDQGITFLVVQEPIN